MMKLNLKVFEWLCATGTPGAVWFVLFSFIIGACFGSFATACIWRVPRGISIMWPPSRCPRCGHQITPSENIPLLSWLMLRGKCSGCGLPISSKYFFTELTMALLFTAVAVKYVLLMPERTLGMIPMWILLWMAVASARTDLEKLVIPNMFTYTAAVLALICAVVLPDSSAMPGLSPLKTLLLTICSGAAMLIFGLSFTVCGRLLFKRDAFGLGDVKYLTAAAMLTGLPGTLGILILACILSLVWIVLDRMRRGRFRRYFPFGPFLALGTIIWVLAVNTLRGQMVPFYIGIF